jgi:CBS domain-containing protein
VEPSEEGKLKMTKGMKKELRPLLFSLLFLGLGVFVLWVANSLLRHDPDTSMGEVVLVSLLVMPILVYAILSGSLTELKGPGKWEASFKVIATAPVNETTNHDRVSVEEDSLILAKGGVDKLERQIRNLDENRPSVMTVTFGGAQYTPEALLEYVEAFWRSRNFKFVVILDRDSRFLAYMPAWATKNLLTSPGRSEEFVKVLNEERQELFSYPGVVRKTISTASTNAEALREMMAKNLEALVVTDQDNRLKGIAEREQILTKMVLDMTR